MGLWLIVCCQPSNSQQLPPASVSALPEAFPCLAPRRACRLRHALALGATGAETAAGMATTTVASLLALVERPDIWAHIA